MNLESLIQDARFGLRVLFRRPAFTTVVVVGTVVEVVAAVVVVAPGSVVVVVADGQGRFGGRGRHTNMTESMSTAGVALRATAITRSGCRLA